MDNSVKYTLKGGVTVQLKNHDSIKVVVKDTGIGIPPAEQKHLFSSFFRASNAITMKNVGTGLGLFIVRNIMNGHGGQIDCVSSDIDKGTEFAVTLPAATAER